MLIKTYVKDLEDHRSLRSLKDLIMIDYTISLAC